MNKGAHFFEHLLFEGSANIVCEEKKSQSAISFKIKMTSMECLETFYVKSDTLKSSDSKKTF